MMPLFTSYLPLGLSLCRSSRAYPHSQTPCCSSPLLKKFPPKLFRNLHLSFKAVNEDEGRVSVMSFEDLAEKDWSFLENVDTTTEEEQNQIIDKIILAAEIGETSRVLICIGSHVFVDRVVNSFSFKQLLVVHQSLLTLALIKEKYDAVKCWQGELIYLPEKWSPFDVVYLYYLPALPFQLAQLLEALAKHCLPGARVVISHPQGREKAERQQIEYPDIVLSKLPDKIILSTVAADHLFTVDRFVDEPRFYLVVLKFKPNDC